MKFIDMKSVIFTVSLVFMCASLVAQSTFVPGGTVQNSNNTYMGIGTTTPSARFHVQQAGTGWNDGIRLSLMGRNWDIVADASGTRLVLSHGQNMSNAVFLYAPGSGPTMHVNGSLVANNFIMPSGDGQTNFAINSPATSNEPFQITLGYQSINGGIMIGRPDWLSKVLIPWDLALGSAAPTARLDIQQNAGGWGDGIRLSYAGHHWDFVTDTNGDRLLIANDEDVSKGLVMYNGNLGVGVSNPEQKLHVNGKIKAQSIDVLGSISAGSMRMLSDDGQTAFYVEKPTDTGKPFTMALGYGNIDGGIMIGRQDWISKVVIPWNVAIGTDTPHPGFLVTVDGKLKSEEINVEIVPDSPPDYVFEENYDLLSIADLEQYIKAYKHLPEVPSGSEMEENGMNLKEMNLLLLKKVEELTLHLIAQHKINLEQRKVNEDILKEIEILKRGKCR